MHVSRKSSDLLKLNTILTGNKGLSSANTPGEHNSTYHKHQFQLVPYLKTPSVDSLYNVNIFKAKWCAISCEHQGERLLFLRSPGKFNSPCHSTAVFKQRANTGKGNELVNISTTTILKLLPVTRHTTPREFFWALNEGRYTETNSKKKKKRKENASLIINCCLQHIFHTKIFSTLTAYTRDTSLSTNFLGLPVKRSGILLSTLSFWWSH